MVSVKMIVIIIAVVLVIALSVTSSVYGYKQHEANKNIADKGSNKAYANMTSTQELAYVKHEEELSKKDKKIWIWTLIPAIVLLVIVMVVAFWARHKQQGGSYLSF